MAHLNFENDVNSLLRLDAPTNGPAMRWQRKAAEASCNNSINTSQCCTPMKTSNKSFNASMTAKTPSKTPKTPRRSKTPGKTPGKSKTPSKTPSGDRFIPSRSTTNFDVGHFKVMNEKKDDENCVLSPTKLEQQKALAENLNGHLLDSRILSYTSKPPQAPEGYQNNLKVLYSQSNKTPGSSRKSTRHISALPERILDAPDIIDDYYLNLIDWSCNNHLAVALHGNVYLWNAGNGEIQRLMQMENPEDYVSSVNWIKEGNYLAVGTSCGEVQLWDVTQNKRVRNMTGHAGRVCSLSWNSFIVSSGSRTGHIHHHDVRIPNHRIATLSGHTQEVCGLAWSPCGRFLASGGNDNILNIWNATVQNETSSPIHTFTQHQAAVKALSWCPWQPSVLASGGGTADRHIRFWNANTGALLNSVDTRSQICSILWSKEYKELISAHGFANNQLIIWKYPTMTKVCELTGHTSRVLHMAMSPDGTMVVSAAADETLRLWRCFAVDPNRKKEKTLAGGKMNSNTLMRQSIR
ncbi:cell division cycle protein 20 homolog [Glandiceps talaboti]